MQEGEKDQFHQPLIKPAIKNTQNKQENKELLLPPAPFFSLFKFAAPYDIVLMTVGSIAALAAGTMFPLFTVFFGQITMIFVEQKRGDSAAEGLNIAIKFFILGGLTWLLNMVALYCWSVTGARQVLMFKKTYYQLLLSQQISWYDSIDSNQLATQVSGNIVAIEVAISQKMAIIQSIMVTTIFGFFYAFFNCWQLSLVLSAALPLLLIAGVLLMKSMTLAAQKNKISYQLAGGIAEQAIAAIKTIKSLVGETFELNKFTSALQKSFGKTVRYTFYSALSIGFVIMIFLGTYALGFWYGKTLIVEDPTKYDSAKIIATFFCFVIGGGSIGQISPILKNFGEARAAVAKILNLMERQRTLIEKDTDGVQIDQINEIELKNVSFKYPKLKAKEDQLTESVEALKNVSIKFEKNKVTALVGESGSGKSTIVQLLMRYYDPTSGQILINNYPLSQLSTEKYRRKIGAVGQQPVLFSMSINENLMIANPQATEQQIKQALKKANIADFLENNMEIFAGSGGNQLSGGQKQRIAIARAICRKTSLLILDQATSALDKKNQREIQSTLKAVENGGVTTIVVAHRLSTIKNADKIIVMKKGQVVEVGTHEQLFEKKGKYFQLVKTQMTAQSQQQNKIEKNNLQNIAQKQQVKQSKQKKLQVKAPQHSEQKLNAVFGKIFKASKENISLYIIGVLFCIINGSIFPFYNIALGNVLALLPQAFDPKKAAEINDYCILFAIVAVSGGIATFTYQFCFGLIGERLVFKLRKQIFQKLLRMPISFYDKPYNSPGAITTKLSQDSFQIHNMTTGVIGVIFLNLSTVTLSLVFAFYYSWKLTLIVFGLSPLLVITQTIQMAAIKRIAMKAQTSQKSLGTQISDTVNNIRTVKSFGYINEFPKRFLKNLQQVFDSATKKALANSILQGLSRGMIMFVEGLIFWIAAILYQNNLIQNPQDIYISVFAIIFAAMGIGNNSAYMPDMAKAKVAGANIFDIIQAKDQQQISVQQGGKLNPTLRGKIQFKNVTFKYPQRQQLILDNFNLCINQGQKIGLVGPSGSGKSSILQLLMRFYPIQSGEILVDGCKIQQYQLYHYRKQIGLVSQEPTIFQGTIKQNIQYSNQKTISKIKKYTNIANATQFIQASQEGFNKEVGQKGSQVSGGQKQRIAIARCLIKKPKIILLDQSTSALDEANEKKLFKNMKPILSGKTSISVAHRLSTIQDANRIIMMRNGKIIESGTFDQLMSLKENFYRLAKGVD